MLAQAACRALSFLSHLGWSVSYDGHTTWLKLLQELTEDAEIVNVRFTKSVIASKAAFEYGEAQLRKDDP